MRSVRKEIRSYIDSVCQPPSKPPDKQNSLEGEISKKVSSYINPIYRLPPKPPYTQNTKGERKWTFRRKLYIKSDYRPPPKPPDIPELSRILVDLKTNLNKDHLHREIQLALEIKPEKILYLECISIKFITFRKVKIVIVNLTEFCRSLFAEKQDPNSNERGNKITDAEI